MRVMLLQTCAAHVLGLWLLMASPQTRNENIHNFRQPHFLISPHNGQPDCGIKTKLCTCLHKPLFYNFTMALFPLAIQFYNFTMALLHVVCADDHQQRTGRYDSEPLVIH